MIKKEPKCKIPYRAVKCLTSVSEGIGSIPACRKVVPKKLNSPSKSLKWKFCGLIMIPCSTNSVNSSVMVRSGVKSFSFFFFLPFFFLGFFFFFFLRSLDLSIDAFRFFNSSRIISSTSRRIVSSTSVRFSSLISSAS